MTKLEKYDLYKNSGVDWLGEIPKHWETKRIKHLFNIGRGRVISQQELDDQGLFPVYSSQTKNDGILGYIKTFDYDCKQITWTTDGANAGTVFLRNGKHNCTNVCGTLKNRNKEEVLEFINYSLKIATQFYKRPDTNGAKIMNNEMAEIFIPYPSIQEQQKIAPFLDEKTNQIDQAITQKQKLIELLKEQKQIVINDAVTKGLDPNVELKESGIDWIGKIPKHWEVKKLKHICVINRKTLDENTNKNLEIKYVDIGSVSFEFGITKVENFLFSKAPSRARRIAKKNDTIISTVRTYLKAINFIDELKSSYIFSTGFAVLEPNKNLKPQFLTLLVKSNFFTNQVSVNSKGMSYPAINSTDLSNLIVLFPPKIEQQQIADYLDSKITQIDNFIALTQKQIEKLKEYKTVLIDNVVTGKVRVA